MNFSSCDLVIISALNLGTHEILVSDGTLGKIYIFYLFRHPNPMEGV